MAARMRHSLPPMKLSNRKNICYACGVVQLVVVVYVYSVFQSSTQIVAVSRTSSPQDKPPVSHMSSQQDQDKPLIVMGILTADVKRDLRDAQRNTWLSSAMQADNPFRVKYMFLIDKPTNETIEENKLYKDILYLNATFTGVAKRYGEKLYKWLKYVHDNYPDAQLAARIDDDVFLCVPQMFHRLYELKSSKLYYGWAHGKGDAIGFNRRVDEMFVVLGRDIIERIAKRKYCYDKETCDDKKDLIDTNFGGTSIGVWLSNYSDIDFHPDNGRIVHFGKEAAMKNVHKVRSGFCDNSLIFHKSSTTQMKQLHDYNKDRLQGLAERQVAVYSSVVEGGTTGALFSGSAVRPAPSNDEFSKPLEKLVKDATRDCDNWAVVTTIFERSEAVTRLIQTPSWCIVVVADVQTPSRELYMANINITSKDRVTYLDVTEQQNLFSTLALTIPYKHFGRKNIGYIYAMQHKASVIWDFDDDNIGVVDVNDFNAKDAKFVTACADFKGNLVNPYPYFGAQDNRTWPRGLPLQHVKDKNIVPKMCASTEKPNFGVVQSLANVQPDVDAIFRLTRDVPFNFTAKKDTHPAFIMPRNAYAPFNAQATLWTRQAFLYMALPLTVSGRVSDIWRSYIALHFMHREGVQLAFSQPYVTQHRNEHMDIKDFNAELHLYERSQQFVDFLSSNEARTIKSLSEMYVDLYRRAYLELNDLRFIDAWTKTYNDIYKQ